MAYKYENSSEVANVQEEGLIDILLTLAENKRLIIGMPIVSTVIAFGIASALAPTYRATTTILPPQQSQSSAAALLSQFGGAASLVAGAAGIKNPSDLYIAMLKSRAISDQIIRRFNLIKTYKVDSKDEALKQLEKNTTISSGKEGMITIVVDHDEKNRVAEITNAYADELAKLTKVLALTEASQRRLFFERQLEETKERLASSEVQLKKGLDTNGVISVDSDSRAILETLARLRAQASAKEIQLRAMSSFVTYDNPEYKRAQQELVSLRAEVSKLENGGPSDGDEKQKTPSGLSNIKILRDVKYNQMLYELLAKQYEVARLDEARDSSTIQVLDKAETPEKSSSPKRVRIAVSTGIFALVLAMAIAFCKSAFNRALQKPAFASKWEILSRQLRFAKR